MQKQGTATLIAGLLSGVLWDFPGVSPAVGSLIPYIPLLALGLSEGLRSAVNACLIAIIVAMLLSGAHSGFNIALFVAVPCCLLLSSLLRFRVSETGVQEWNPALRAVVDLTLLISGIYMTLAVAAGYAYPEGMRAVLKKSLPMDYSQMTPEVGEMMQKLTGDWNFFIFAFGAWLWILLTLGMAWVAQSLLIKHGKALRSDIRLKPLGGIPHWLLALIGVCFVLAFAGAENDRFNAKVVALILLLPYFLSGMAYLHALSYQWRPRVLWLFCIYIILLFFQWSLVLPTVAGLYFQLFEMLDKPKKIG